MSYIINANCRKFSLVISFMLLCLIGKSQYNFAALDKLFADKQKAWGNNLIALIYKDGKIIYRKEMGEFNMKLKLPVGSCSQWLTAALVMTFADEGKISLDDTVSAYLPEFETYRKPLITIRQCLSHQTGIEDNIHAVTKFFERRRYPSLEKEVISFAQRGISADPGTTFIYGNMGPDIAGRVLEVISKTKFDVLMKQRIFIPLNMKNSSFTPEDNAVDPSAGAVSTAADYMNFLAMILDKGRFMGKQILSESALKQMRTIQTRNIPKKYAPKFAEGYEYGLGEWIEETYGGGNSAVLSCPGLTVGWPYVDLCRNYACILFIKKIPDDEKKAFYLEIKKVIDGQIPAECK